VIEKEFEGGEQREGEMERKRCGDRKEEKERIKERKE